MLVSTVLVCSILTIKKADISNNGNTTHHKNPLWRKPTYNGHLRIAEALM